MFANIRAMVLVIFALVSGFLFVFVLLHRPLAAPVRSAIPTAPHTWSSWIFAFGSSGPPFPVAHPFTPLSKTESLHSAAGAVDVVIVFSSQLCRAVLGALRLFVPTSFEIAQIARIASASYGAGLFAALSPCVLVIIPLIVYRFTASTKTQSSVSPVSIPVDESFSFSDVSGCRNSSFGNGSIPTSTPRLFKGVPSKQATTVALFALGFILSHIVFGFLLRSIISFGLFTSFHFISFQEKIQLIKPIFVACFLVGVHVGLRHGGGAVCATLGTLSFFDRLDPVSLPIVSNPILLGVSFAIMFSLNPCAIPFLGMVVSLYSSHAVLALTVFACGMLTPLILCVVLGRGFLSLVRRYTNLVHLVDRGMSIALCVTGGYLVFGGVVYPAFNSVDILIALSLTFFGAFLAWRRSLKQCSYGNVQVAVRVLCNLLCCVLLAMVIATGIRCLWPGDSHSEDAHTALALATSSVATDYDGGSGELDDDVEVNRWEDEDPQCLDFSLLPQCNVCLQCTAYRTVLSTLIVLAIVLAECTDRFLAKLAKRRQKTNMSPLSPLATSPGTSVSQQHYASSLLHPSPLLPL